MREASGVTWKDGTLWVVGNEDDGACFAFSWPEAEGNLGPRFEDRVLHLDATRAHRIDLRAGARASDLESIDHTPDGRLFALSENQRTLFSDESSEEVTFTNHKWAMEVDSKGLEGLAIRPDGLGYAIAAMWEGGRRRSNPTPPRVIVRRAPTTSPDEVVQIDRDFLNQLHDGDQVRAADLVWAEHSRARPPGFLVLLHCERKGEKKHKWLVRVDERGGPVESNGAPAAVELIDLFRRAGAGKPKKWAKRNWEGLGWINPGKRLVMVNDNDEGECYAFVFDL